MKLRHKHANGLLTTRFVRSRRARGAVRRWVKRVERQVAKQEMFDEMIEAQDPQLVEDDFGERCPDETCPICYGDGETALDVYFAMKSLRDRVSIAVMGWALP
jgi:hypothetical protein